MNNPKPKKTESKTQPTETKIQNSILEKLPIGICRIDLKGTVKYINKYFEEMTGYTRDEIIGRNALKLGLFPDDIRSYILKRIAARIGGAPSQKLDTQFKCKDGTWTWITMESTIIRKSGVPVGFQIAASDITERKQAENALKESEQRLRIFLNSTSDMAYLKDENFRHIMANRALCKFYGKTENEIIGSSDFNLMAEKSAAECRKTDEQTLLLNALQIAEEVVEGRYYETMKFPVELAENKIGIGAYIRDITERKHIEEALQESEVKYRLMVESSRDAIVISQNDLFIFVNDAFASMLGYQKEELFMHSYKKVYTEKAVSLLEERARLRSAGKAVADRYETIFRKKDGSELPVEASLRIIDYKGQKATFAVIRDITKQKEIMAALQASAGQSHGLKNHIPICAGCLKIRDDDQESHPWVSPAVYINDRLPKINFTHGMCPDCMKKWYPDFLAEKEKLAKEDES